MFIFVCVVVLVVFLLDSLISSIRLPTLVSRLPTLVRFDIGLRGTDSERARLCLAPSNPEVLYADDVGPEPSEPEGLDDVDAGW